MILLGDSPPKRVAHPYYDSLECFIAGKPPLWGDSPLVYPLKLISPNGDCLMRLPVAAKMALSTAGAVGG